MSIVMRLMLSLSLLFSSFVSTVAPAVQATRLSARPGTEKILKQLGGHPCPDESAFTCVTLTMPLDHFNVADTRTIQVTFAVLPATGNRKGMFVTATGGPGTSGIAVADSYTAAFDPSISRRFDIVFFDQRGVALSGGLHFEPNGAKYAFNLKSCAFTRDFTMTGTGSYDSDKDRFVLTVATTGRWRCDLKYVRTAGNTRVTGSCDGKPVKWEK